MSATEGAVGKAKAREEARHAASAPAPVVEVPMTVKTLISTLPKNEAETAGTARADTHSSFWHSNALPLGMVAIMLLVLLYFAFTVE